MAGNIGGEFNLVDHSAELVGGIYTKYFVNGDLSLAGTKIRIYTWFHSRQNIRQIKVGESANYILCYFNCEEINLLNQQITRYHYT